MKIIITGSESFIGKELIAQCKNNNIEVIGFDVCEKNTNDYEFYNTDIRSQKIADDMPENADALIHLAALSRDTDCKINPYQCFDINVMGTLNLINIAKKKKVQQFIFASSEWVYTDFKNNETKDENSFIDISQHTSEYALSKIVSEANLKQQYENGFCPVTILRFAIVYGPRKINWSAVEVLLSEVKNKDKIHVGSLKTGRCFVYVQDISRGITQAIGFPGFNIFNLSGNQLITLGDIIQESEKIYGKKVQITETNPDVISVRNISNQKAKKILNWQPEISLKAGMKTLMPFI